MSCLTTKVSINITVMRYVCAALSLAVTTSGSALNVVLLAPKEHLSILQSV